jgi:hypothetical protein
MEGIHYKKEASLGAEGKIDKLQYIDRARFLTDKLN